MFRRLAHFTSQIIGSPIAFFLAVVVVLLWAFSGKYFNYSDTWQLVINTGTTIMTFLMVFLVQNTQNREAKAMHIKLDELIRSLQEARDELIDIEDEPDQRISDVQKEFKEISRQSNNALNGQ
jgi:low affinity Fe/Cu permease